MGLPGPSGTPGAGSLSGEQTLTIYKGDKVTQRGRKKVVAFSHHTGTQAHTRMWWGLRTKVVEIKVNRTCRKQVVKWKDEEEQ